MSVFWHLTRPARPSITVGHLVQLPCWIRVYCPTTELTTASPHTSVAGPMCHSSMMLINPALLFQSAATFPLASTHWGPCLLRLLTRFLGRDLLQKGCGGRIARTDYNRTTGKFTHTGWNAATCRWSGGRRNTPEHFGVWQTFGGSILLILMAHSWRARDSNSTDEREMKYANAFSLIIEIKSLLWVWAVYKKETQNWKGLLWPLH